MFSTSRSAQLHGFSSDTHLPLLTASGLSSALSPPPTISRGTRAAILGEAGEDVPVEHEGNVDRVTMAGSRATSCVGGLYGGVDGETRGGLGTRRRIARRQSRHTTETASAVGGWPPPHPTNY